MTGEIRKRPLIIGVAGGTGSGKTTVARRLADALTEHCEAIEHDAYYWDQSKLTDAERSNVNYDHPDSLETSLLVDHIRRLRRRESVEIPIYDFVSHLRLPTTRMVRPAPIILVEGILTLADETLRSLFDIKIFVDTDADIRVFRRIRRDLEQRGRTFASVRERYYNHVRPMHLQFVEPSKRWADLIVPEGGDNAVAIDLLITKLERVAEDEGLDTLTDVVR